MPATEDIDQHARENVKRWLMHYWHHVHRFTSDAAVARALGLAAPTITNIKNGKRLPGFDVMLAMHVKWHLPPYELIHVAPPSAPRTEAERLTLLEGERERLKAALDAVDAQLHGTADPSEAPASGQPRGRMRGAK